MNGQRQQAAEAVLRRLVNTDNGLEFRKWMIAGESAALGPALESYRAGEALGPDRVAALRDDLCANFRGDRIDRYNQAT